MDPVLMMAQRTIVQLTDDLDGKPIPDGKGETVRFSLDRTDYEIDLGEKKIDVNVTSGGTEQLPTT